MKNRWGRFGICILIVVAFSCSKSPEEAPIISAQRPYFIPIEIVCNARPTVLVKIGNKTIPAEVDLGFFGYLSLPNEFLEPIEKKTFLGTKKMYGLRGKEYEKPIYRIPYTQVGGVMFSEVPVQQEAEDFGKNGSFLGEGSSPIPDHPARAGWEIFRLFNLFLDLGNSQIAFCDSLSRLEKEGYSINGFISSPLLLERGFIEVEAQTEKGPLRCVLDTGTTWNLLNQPLEEGRTIDEMVKSVYEMGSFKIGKTDFGPLEFRSTLLELPIHLDAILGMEFFNNHLVFIDFANGQISFSKK